MFCIYVQICAVFAFVTSHPFYFHYFQRYKVKENSSWSIFHSCFLQIIFPIRILEVYIKSDLVIVASCHAHFAMLCTPLQPILRNIRDHILWKLLFISKYCNYVNRKMYMHFNVINKCFKFVQTKGRTLNWHNRSKGGIWNIYHTVINTPYTMVPSYKGLSSLN